MSHPSAFSDGRTSPCSRAKRKNVEITLSPTDLEDLHLLDYWDTTLSAWTTTDGTYAVTVGSSFNTVLRDTSRSITQA